MEIKTLFIIGGFFVALLVVSISAGCLISPHNNTTLQILSVKQVSAGFNPEGMDHLIKNEVEVQNTGDVTAHKLRIGVVRIPLDNVTATLEGKVSEDYIMKNYEINFKNYLGEVAPGQIVKGELILLDIEPDPKMPFRTYTKLITLHMLIIKETFLQLTGEPGKTTVNFQPVENDSLVCHFQHRHHRISRVR